MKKKREVTVLQGSPVTDLEIKAPEWVAKTEDIGNAMYATAQEFLLVIEDALVRYHQFSEEEIKRLHEEIRPVLKGVAEYERAGLSLLSPNDIQIVGDIAESRLLKEGAWRHGLETPILPPAAPFLKELKKRNRDDKK